jgi:peptidoglycan/xylan/chitin deacetylase (PgdA/CDA1 family)
MRRLHAPGPSGRTAPAALVVAYHDIGPGRSPLDLGLDLFRAHLECLADAGVAALTVSQLGRALRECRLPARAVCLTFDDGFASVPDTAAPLLREHGLAATVFAVSGRLGGTNDWPSQPGWVERRRLAGATQLTELARSGFEIGAHGVEHEPLGRVEPAVVRREVVEGKSRLEDALGLPVESFAYPYGSVPGASGRALVAETYAVACTVRPRPVRLGDDLHAVPRVDAHYLRRPEQLRRMLESPHPAQLLPRRAARRFRRVVTAGW